MGGGGGGVAFVLRSSWHHQRFFMSTGRKVLVGEHPKDGGSEGRAAARAFDA